MRAPSTGGSAAGGSSVASGSLAGGRETSSGDRAAGPTRRQQQARERRERRLRRTIRELRPCLPLLSRLAERVLVLRAGVGDREPHSRAAVARRVEKPVRVVRRVERRGVRRLRALMRAGDCSGSAAAAPDGAGASGAAFASSGGDTQVALPEASGSGAPGSGSGDAGAVKGERSESGRDGPGSGGPIAGLLPRPADPVELTVPLLVVLAGLGVLAGWRARRRHSA